jgi:hypothetical protein
LDFVLVEIEETMCGDGSSWLAAQSSGLLRKLDEGEKPISFNAHKASHVIGWGFHTFAFLPVARIARQVLLTKLEMGRFKCNFFLSHRNELHPHLSIAPRYVLPATIYRYSSNLSCAISIQHRASILRPALRDYGGQVAPAFT